MTLALHLSRVWRTVHKQKRQVESQMKILDEIHAYQGKLTIQEVEEQIQKLFYVVIWRFLKLQDKYRLHCLKKKRNLLPHFQQK